MTSSRPVGDYKSGEGYLCRDWAGDPVIDDLLCKRVPVAAEDAREVDGFVDLEARTSSDGELFSTVGSLEVSANDYYY